MLLESTSSIAVIVVASNDSKMGGICIMRFCR
jgi:hypothetical protein